MLEFLLFLFFNIWNMPIINNVQLPQTVQVSVYSDNSSNIEKDIKSSPTPVHTVEPTLTPAPSPTPNITPTPEATPTPYIPPEKENIEMNYADELSKLGYIKNDTNDNDVNLRNGVLRFQSNSNLIADGIWGPISNASLTKRVKNNNFEYRDTISNPPTDNYWIFINKTRRTLTLYKGSSVVSKYPVAVGNPPSLTPEGRFKIAIKVVNPYWGGGGYAKPVPGGVPENPLGYRWMGLDLGGGGEYGIHGNNAPYSIGTYASHGCIRMINTDVESLFEIVPEETPVWIGSDDNMADYGIKQKEY